MVILPPEVMREDEAMKLRSEIVSFFTDEDPKGPEVSKINALHRGHDGYITFHSAVDENGAPAAKVRPMVAIRASHIEGMFPQFANALMDDAFFSINGFAAPKREEAKDVLAGGTQVYRSTMLRYLCTAHVDIDCYNLGRTPGQIIGEVIDLQLAKKIPSPSVYALSGRGLWMFWFLRDEENPSRPPRAFESNVLRWAAIERKLLEGFSHLGADPNASGKVTQISRVPGSINSKSGEHVKWWIPGEGTSTYSYTLAELAKRFDVSIDEKTRDIVQKRIPNNARGHVALNRLRLEQFELLRQIRGGFREGHRHRAIVLYSQLLKTAKLTDDELIEAVERLGAECIPPYEGDAGRQAVSILVRKGALWFFNRTLADNLDITPDEHAQLREVHGKSAWPMASRFQPKGVGHALGDTDASKDERERAKLDRVKARRVRLLELFDANPKATYRELGHALREEGYVGSSPRIVMEDLKVLGLKTQEVERRDRERRIKKAQESLLQSRPALSVSQ